MAMTPYIIKQGDYLTQLAHRMGFDPDKVWNDPANADLKAARKDPDVLAPGDVLQIPGDPPTKVPISIGSSNKYQATIPQVTVTVALKDGNEPIKNERYVLEGLADPVNGSTDGDGKITFVAPVHVREVHALLPDRNERYPIHIGHLDPIEEPSGWRQRLEHLGFYGWTINPSPDDPLAPHPSHDRGAIAAFQATKGLPETGEMDPATRDALESAFKAGDVTANGT